MGCSKFDFHILQFGFLFRNLNFEILSQFIILLQSLMKFSSISFVSICDDTIFPD